MSTNPDEAGALSPAERDFALRRMPVETLAESYRAANVEPADLGAPVTAVDRAALLQAVDELRAFAARLHGAAQWENALHIRAIERAIREALK